MISDKEGKSISLRCSGEDRKQLYYNIIICNRRDSTVLLFTVACDRN